jgi:hypothetical protein
MTTYVQFKDGVAHAHVTTDGDLSGYDFKEVTCSGHQHLGQSWNGVEWVDAQPIRYAILDDRNTIVQIENTLYASEVKGKILDDEAIQVNWTFDGEKFNPPINLTDQIQAENIARQQAIVEEMQRLQLSAVVNDTINADETTTHTIEAPTT